MKSIFKYGFILFTCSILFSLSCEDLDLDNDAAGEVQGFWELRQNAGSNTFLLISDTDVIYYYYDAIENCITLDAYQVVRIDGSGFYILTQEGLEENKVLAISKNGERIHVRDIEDTQSDIVKFFESQVDINALAPICVDPTDVYGNWELENENGEITYLSVREDSIFVIDKETEQNCYFSSGLEVYEINGSVFTISDNDPESTEGKQEVILTRTNDGLVIERMENNVLVKELFVESTTDFSTFIPICDFILVLEEYFGTWQYNTSSEEVDLEFYLTISPESMIFHFRIGDPINDPDNVCFDVQSFKITSIGENSVTIVHNVEPFETEEYFLEFNEEEGLLYLTSIFEETIEVLTFFKSDIDQGYINNQCPDLTIPVTKIF